MTKWHSPFRFVWFRCCRLFLVVVVAVAISSLIAFIRRITSIGERSTATVHARTWTNVTDQLVGDHLKRFSRKTVVKIPTPPPKKIYKNVYYTNNKTTKQVKKRETKKKPNKKNRSSSLRLGRALERSTSSHTHQEVVRRCFFFFFFSPLVSVFVF